MTEWLKPEREHTKAVWQRIGLIWTQNKQFKTKTDIIESALDLLDKELMPKPINETPSYILEQEHYELCRKRHMLNYFPDNYFSKEELEKLRERYPNVKRFRKEREKAQKQIKTIHKQRKSHGKNMACNVPQLEKLRTYR